MRDPGVGLCVVCAYSACKRSARGSRFYSCRRSVSDAGYPRYPQLPVFECSGFERIADPKADESY